MEVIPAYEELLREDKAFIASLEKKLEPTCSGLVIELGLDCQYPQLAHHNFFFSGHQKEHFAKVFEHFWTPLDIRAQHNSNRGSIHGVVSDRGKNLAFKAPKQSTKYPNLFFVGGSVNPGGGMPMVVLCGQNVAKKVVAWDRA